MKIKVSVHDIVDFTLRSGSLISGAALGKRALSGTKLHTKLQKRHSKKASKKGLFYDEEYTLNTEYVYGEYEFEIEGRADGVIQKKDGAYIEEIKSTTRELSLLTENNISPAHIAQLKCYGYMYLAENNGKNVSLALIYSDIKGKEEVIFDFSNDFTNLQIYFKNVIAEYARWLDIYMGYYREFVSSAENMPFPYGEFRKGQRELSVAVYQTLVSKKQFFAQAPTGTGKTMSTLFPSVKYAAKYFEYNRKIFYATAKNQTREAAEKAVEDMAKNGLSAKTITLTAKSKICTRKGGACHTDNCLYAKGHFDRINDCIEEVLSSESCINADIITYYAEKYIVCPFELELDLSLFCQIVICDYNYIYDPSAQLCRYFDETTKFKEPVLLIDEAHNFPDRARDMYTAEITTSELFEASFLFGQKKPSHLLTKIKNIIFDTLGDERWEMVADKLPTDITETMQEFIFAADDYMEKNPNSPNKEKISDIYFKINDFLKITEFFGKNFRMIYTRNFGNKVAMKIFCSDASKIISQINKKIASVIAFSATFEPLKYYIDICGGADNVNYALAPSPFPPENLLIICDYSLSVTYRSREKNYENVSDRLFAFISAKIGNYFIFFPSYKYMNDVYSIFTKAHPEILTALQETAMTEEEGKFFLEKFVCQREQSFAAFAVLGGIFSEGIDLKGEKLIGTAVISTGLPQICTERDIMSAYYSDIYGKGFDYAYRFPGMNKVLQAAGRVIRTENDRGVVLLIDERFAREDHRNLFPAFWENIHYTSSLPDMEQKLKDFWQVR